MTDPKKFDAAARLLRALDKMDRKYADKSQAMIAKHAAERKALLAAADPEVRAMVEAAEPDRYDAAFSERIDDEYADPDGNPCLSDGVDAELRAALLPVLRTAVTRATIWACEEVGRRSYSAEEVAAMMRDENPDWFEPEDHTDA